MNCSTVSFAILTIIALCGCDHSHNQHSTPAHKVTMTELQSLERKHAAKRHEYLQAVTTLTSNDERREIVKDFSYGYWLPAIEQMLEISEKQPASPVGKHAAIWVVSSCDADYEPHQRAANLLLVYHAHVKELGPVCQNLVGFSPVYEKLLRAVASSNASANARGSARFQLAELLVQRADFRAMMDATPEVRKELSRNMGDETTSFLESTDRARDRDEAKLLYTLVQQQYSDVPYRGQTLADVAAKRLMRFEQTYPVIGAAAPNTEGLDLDGNVLSLARLRGKVTVVTFWASWCGACLERVPEENQLMNDLQDSRFALLGVNGDETLEDARRAVVEHGIEFVSWWDDPAAESSIVDQWGVSQWPTTFVLDEAGVIRYKNLAGPELRSAVTRLLENASTANNGEPTHRDRGRISPGPSHTT